MSAARALTVASALNALYGRSPGERLAEIRHAVAELARLSEVNGAVDFEQIARQAGGIQQAALKGAAAERALAAGEVGNEASR